MNEVIEVLHETTTLTKSDLFSVFWAVFIFGCFATGSIQAFIQFIVNKVKEKKNDKTSDKY